MKIGVLMYTYNRTDDAKVNMEIIRNIWGKNELLKDITIVHSFNGEKDWWPEKYLEDELLYLHNPGHFEGAELLINEGVKAFKDKYPDMDYVILLASDTWCVKPQYIENILKTMEQEEKYLATAVWGTKKVTDIWVKGSALDFNIFNIKWANEHRLFPIRFKEFKEKFEELFFYRNETVYPEIVFMVRFLQAISQSINIASDNILRQVAEEHILRMTDREPVHDNFAENLIFRSSQYIRHMHVPKMGLITHHDPVEKQRVLKKYKLNLGDSGKKIINATDLSYYNRGLDKNVYIKGGKKIGYGD